MGCSALQKPARYRRNAAAHELFLQLMMHTAQPGLVAVPPRSSARRKPASGMWSTTVFAEGASLFSDAIV